MPRGHCMSNIILPTDRNHLSDRPRKISLSKRNKMLGKLNDTQIEEVLKKQLFGRIGCHADGVTYIVPISYAYDGVYIYGHTYEGMKMEMMRKNPNLCFEVDIMENMANWNSVIGWGEFEEVTDKREREKGINLLLNRTLPFIYSETMKLTPQWPFPVSELGEIKGIIFRFRLKEKTGRFESSENRADFYAS